MARGSAPRPSQRSEGAKPMTRTGRILAGVVPAIALAAGTCAAQPPARPTVGEGDDDDRDEEDHQALNLGSRHGWMEIRRAAIPAMGDGGPCARIEPPPFREANPQPTTELTTLASSRPASVRP